MSSTTWIIVGIIGVLTVALIASFNKLVSLRNRVKNAFSQIDVQLKRRYDLVPNLVETAKGYLKHERETLEAVITARNAAGGALQALAAQPGNPEALKKLLGAEGVFSGALGKLMAVAESYPDLKASEPMSQLMEELRATENKIAFARQAYNDAVMAYNTARESFPANVVASNFDFAAAAVWEIEDMAERKPIRVAF